MFFAQGQKQDLGSCRKRDHPVGIVMADICVDIFRVQTAVLTQRLNTIDQEIFERKFRREPD